MKRIIILGSTGSIGRQTLEIVRRNSRKFRVVGLAGGENWEQLLAQVREFQPKFVSTKFPEKFTKVKVKILSLEELAAKKSDLTVSAISGISGLRPTLIALGAGCDVALANKESLVLAGRIVMQTARKNCAQIFPIDSEHSGVWQLLKKTDLKKIRRVILTASGGALRDLPYDRLKDVSPHEVLAHPTWSMGAKITLDSATLANKAYEIIEAHHLFGIPLEKIEAIIHPQSVVHALIETIDGSLLAQLAAPDMRLPISYALFGGERYSTPVKFLELGKQNLEFLKIDSKKYPLFEIILKAEQRGGLASVVAATTAEIAGEKFLTEKIKFTDISKIVKWRLLHVPSCSANLKNIFTTIDSLKKELQ